MLARKNKHNKNTSRQHQRDVQAKSSLAAMNSTVSYPSALQRSPFPPHLRRTLRYVDIVSLTSTSGSTASQQYQVNSLFDPDLTGTGHQPRFYDQMCASTGPYTRYRVLSHRVKVTAGDSTGAGQSSVIACGYSSTSALPSGDPTLDGELPGWKVLLYPPENTSGVPVKMSAAADVALIAAQSPQAILSNPDFAGVYNGSPANLVYFSVSFKNLQSGTITLAFLFEHEFDCQFEEPLLVAAS